MITPSWETPANDNNDNGIYLMNGCDNNTISGNTASNVGTTNQDWGIYLEKCDNNTISGNTANDNSDFGIVLSDYCNDNTILGNTANNNIIGIYLVSICNDNIISENIVYENTAGIELTANCNDNLIFYNVVFNNSASNGYDPGSSNNWDNGTIGNYWSDYTGIDADYDGIGDTPYDVSGGAGNKDNKPLMNYNPFFFKTPEDLTYGVGTEGHELRWTIINTSPDLLPFNIFRDGTSIKTGGVFYVANEIIINIDGLDAGTHGFTIEVADGHGGIFTDGVWVTVTSNSNSNPSSVIIIIEEDENNDDDDKEEDDNLLLIVGIASAMSAVGAVSVISAILFKKRLKLKR